MKFYVESLKCGRDAFNILSEYSKISNYKTEEIIKETSDGENVLHYLAVYFKTPKDILKFSDEVGYELIIDGSCDTSTGIPEITIYDDYME